MILLLLACSDYNLAAPKDSLGAAPPRDLDPKLHTDVTHQRPVITQVDVLWVIDNSSSMEDDQQNLTAAFPAFMDFFIGIGLDYHIGVISTDMYANDGQGKLQEQDGYRWIDPTFPDPIPFFQFMATLGTDGSGDEMARAPVRAAMEQWGSTWNEGFFREGALLSTIVISDEDDSSNMEGVPLPSFVNWYRSIKPDPELAIYSTIVGPVPDGCSTANPGYQHVEATQQIGGLNWSICDNRWDEVLENLAIQSAGMKIEFFLEEIPIPESLSVSVDEGGEFVFFDYQVDFVYNAPQNSIQFNDYVPPAGAEVRITYEVEGTVEG